MIVRRAVSLADGSSGVVLPHATSSDSGADRPEHTGYSKQDEYPADSVSIGNRDYPEDRRRDSKL